MDFNSLKDQVSNLTLYDLKAGVRKVQNGEFTHASSGKQWCLSDPFEYSCYELYGDGVEGMAICSLVNNF